MVGHKYLFCFLIINLQRIIYVFNAPIFKKILLEEIDLKKFKYWKRLSMNMNKFIPMVLNNLNIGRDLIKNFSEYEPIYTDGSKQGRGL